MADQGKMLLMAERSRLAYTNFMEKALMAPFIDVESRKVMTPTSVGDTPIVIYKPRKNSDVPLPVFVNIHGGGFIQGSTQDDDGWCRTIAAAVDCAVVSIGYRLAPEHKFPVALEECYDIVKWVHEQAGNQGFDPERIAVGGSSAGGNLAAALCLLARAREEFPLVFQVLNYPPLDFSADPELKGRSDTLLTPRAQMFFTACYLRDVHDQRNPLASPLLNDNLVGLPPALIIAAEHDPLCSEDEAYGERLMAAGVQVTTRIFAGSMHAFTHFGPESAATEAWGIIHKKLRQVFWGELSKK